MSQHSVTHGSFTVERTYAASPAEVFEAWASRDAKDRWFGSGQDFLARTDLYSLDFRVGGVERLEGIASRDRTFRYEATHQDIVENERIVMTYEVLVADRRISVSVMTAEITPADGGAHLAITEQGVFLDGLDDNAERRLGGLSNLDSLEHYLAKRVPAATV